MDKIEKAELFARIVHRKQMYGDYPYIVHIKDVVDILTDYGYDAMTIGYLHDVVEDTDITIKEIQYEFGDFISECVDIVTDKPGKNRKERKLKTYSFMKTITEEYELALIVKVADRLSNVKSCVITKNYKLFDMYYKEHTDFKEAIYRENLCEELWKTLDYYILIGKKEVDQWLKQ